MNCEMEFLIESESLARQLNNRVENRLKQFAWRVQRRMDSQLQLESLDEFGKRYTKSNESVATLFKRLISCVIAILPIERML